MSSDFEPLFPNETNMSYCAFLCENDGQIFDDVGKPLLGSQGSISAGSLIGLIEPASWMDFLEDVRTRGTVLGLEMKLHHGRSISNLLLHGAQTPFGVFVFATLISRSERWQGDRSVSSATVADLSPRGEEGTAKPLSEAVHNLKNPISSILSACEYLAAYSQDNLNPEQLQLLTEIESSAETLLQLSDRIAELSSQSRQSTA